MAYMIIMGVFTLIFLCVGIFIGYEVGHKTEIETRVVYESIKGKLTRTKEPDLDPIQVDDEREYEIEQERNGR